MSFDPDSPSDRADMASWDNEYVCSRCGGRGFTFYEKNNPYAVEPCGCDEIEDEEDE